MLNKILVFGGIALAAILIIENMVVASAAFVFISTSKSYVLSFFSVLIGMGIGYGLKGLLSKDHDESEGLDF